MAKVIAGVQRLAVAVISLFFIYWHRFCARVQRMDHAGLGLSSIRLSPWPGLLLALAVFIGCWLPWSVFTDGLFDLIEQPLALLALALALVWAAVRRVLLARPVIWKMLLATLIFVLVVLSSSYRLHLATQQRLPPAWDQLEVTFQATIESVELTGPYQQRFFLNAINLTPLAEQKNPDLSDVEQAQQMLSRIQRLRLNFYRDRRYQKRSDIADPFVGQAIEKVVEPDVFRAGDFQVGDVVSGRARLRSPYRFANGLRFDYEGYLLAKGIDATGFIRQFNSTAVHDADGLATTRAGTKILEAWRQRLALFLQSQLNAQAWSWVQGLLLAQQQAFSQQQWQTARATGTVHLLVVSGLHLALLAGLAMALASASRRLYALISHRSLPGPRLSLALLVLMVTLLYVAIAGFGVSLQRAWLMLVFVTVLLLKPGRWPVLTVLSWALALMLLWQPLIWFQLGFGLSFAAVAALLLFFDGRRTTWLEKLWRPQWLVFLVLAPVLLAWQSPVSLVHIVANVLLIPWVLLVILPTLVLLLFTLLLAQWIPLLAELLPWVQSLLVSAGEGFWVMQQGLLSLPLAELPVFEDWQLLSWLALLMAIRSGVSWPVKLLALPSIVLALVLPQPRSAQVQLMDVGQGLSLVFDNGQQGLVYDLGPAYGQQFDAGNALVAPYLRQRNLSEITLVISHSDNDHAGGRVMLADQSLRRRIRQLWLGQPLLLSIPESGSSLLSTPLLSVSLCQEIESPLSWRVLSYDLRFRFFPVSFSMTSSESASASTERGFKLSDNNASCVLQVDWQGRRFLLPGDIEADRERQLVDIYGERLRSDVLIAPHHGSATSSSLVFLHMVQPQQVWISSGFNNRFGHPHNDVLARYQALGLSFGDGVYNTATDGALRLSAKGDGDEYPQALRRVNRRPWQQ